MAMIETILRSAILSVPHQTLKLVKLFLKQIIKRLVTEKDHLENFLEKSIKFLKFHLFFRKFSENFPN